VAERFKLLINKILNELWEKMRIECIFEIEGKIQYHNYLAIKRC